MLQNSGRFQYTKVELKNCHDSITLVTFGLTNTDCMVRLHGSLPPLCRQAQFCQKSTVNVTGGATWFSRRFMPNGGSSPGKIPAKFSSNRYPVTSNSYSSGGGAGPTAGQFHSANFSSGLPPHRKHMELQTEKWLEARGSKSTYSRGLKYKLFFINHLCTNLYVQMNEMYQICVEQ